MLSRPSIVSSDEPAAKPAYSIHTSRVPLIVSDVESWLARIAIPFVALSQTRMLALSRVTKYCVAPVPSSRTRTRSFSPLTDESSRSGVPL